MSTNGRLLLQRLPRKPLLIGLGVVVLLLVGARFLGRSSTSVALRAVEVTRRDLLITRTATGVVTPRNRVEIKPPIAGRVEEVLVKEGDAVIQGQPLAWMSSAERAALLDAARSQGPEAIARWEAIYKPAPLIAPLEGTVIVRAVEPGQTVTTADPIVVIADHLIVKAQVDETDVGHIKTGQRAVITLDAYPQETIDGHVEHVAYEAETVNNVTIYQVDIRPEDVPDFMRSGMTAAVNIIVAEQAGALTVPVDAIQNSPEGDTVLRRPARGFGQPKPQPVTTGVTDGKWMEIVSGLTEGDQIMVAPLRLPSGNRGGTNPLSPFRRPQQRQPNRQ